ncbi:MAG: glycosyl hydrolase family 18 protein [Bacteroidales bacterium]
MIIRKIVVIHLLMALGILTSLHAQEIPVVSIHAEQSAFYKTHPWPEALPARNQFLSQNQTRATRTIFGYHPYWMNNSWGLYDWNLLSDLCYFSYEVDAGTGNPLTTNSFETAPVVDTALAHGTKVHLCVTLFSGHAQFLGNAGARQNLCAKLAESVRKRKIQGVNIDFEAVPSSQRNALTAFMQELKHYIDTAAPGTQLSMATPAVDWSNTFDLVSLSEVCDFFMVMTYDYYWNLSQTAGPVAPIYPMESGYRHGVMRTLQYYLSKGVPASKIVMGVPYYGRIWPVQSAQAPSPTRGAGSAVMYRSVKGNSSLFNYQTRHYEPASRATYYAYQANGWNHCFIDEVEDLRMKYDLVHAYNLKGVGIWALGYDNGYSELWELLAESFASPLGMSCSDTLFDAGGPAYTPVEYSSKALSIRPSGGRPIIFSFPQLILSQVRLDVFEGCDTTSQPLLSLLPGQSPSNFSTDSFCIYIRPVALGPNPMADFAVAWRCPSAGFIQPSSDDKLQIYPNPAHSELFIKIPERPIQEYKLILFDLTGRVVASRAGFNQGTEIVFPFPAALTSGIYALRIEYAGKVVIHKILVTR